MRTVASPSTLSLISSVNVYKIPLYSPIFRFCHSSFFLTPVRPLSTMASAIQSSSQDLLANPKWSLLVARDPEDRTDLVITLHGDAITVSEKDQMAVQTAYLAKHPNAFWVDFGDFQFLPVEPKVVRYVSGGATALLGSGEFTREE